MVVKTPTAVAGEEVGIGDLDEIISRVADAVAERFKDRISAIEDAVSTAVKQPRSDRMRVAVPPDARLKALDGARRHPNEAATASRIRDMANPRATESGFQPDDVVRLREESEKAKLLRKGDKKLSPDPIYGVVVSYMYTKRNGLRKYKVMFQPGIGKDAATEDELELVEAA